MAGTDAPVWGHKGVMGIFRAEVGGVNADNSEEPRISRITRINQDSSEIAMRAACVPWKSMEAIISNFQHWISVPQSIKIFACRANLRLGLFTAKCAKSAKNQCGKEVMSKWVQLTFLLPSRSSRPSR